MAPGQSQNRRAKVCSSLEVFFTFMHFSSSVVHCPVLLSPSNGTISSNETQFRTKACFSCNVGYNLVGETCLNCTSNGTWSEKQPHCSGALQKFFFIT